MRRISKGYYEYEGYTIMHDGGNGQWGVRTEEDFWHPIWFNTKSECVKYIENNKEYREDSNI